MARRAQTAPRRPSEPPARAVSVCRSADCPAQRSRRQRRATVVVDAPDRWPARLDRRPRRAAEAGGSSVRGRRREVRGRAGRDDHVDRDRRVLLQLDLHLELRLEERDRLGSGAPRRRCRRRSSSRDRPRRVGLRRSAPTRSARSTRGRPRACWPGRSGCVPLRTQIAPSSSPSAAARVLELRSRS